jgi:ATP synthase protein I
MKDDSALKILFKAGTVGIHLVLCTFIGLAMGYYLDKWLGTKPWLTIVFLLLGIAAGFKELIGMAMKSDEGDGGDEGDEGADKKHL